MPRTTREAVAKHGDFMLKQTLAFAAVSLTLAGGAWAQSSDVASGNMHFDAKDMDTNGDNMITKDEMMAYGEKMWKMMSKGADSIPVKEAAADFAQGGLKFSAHGMDTDHDGTVSKEEFMKYAAHKFDKMKGSNGMISVADATKDFSTGNMPGK
jgi:EF-hand domain pair/EF hand